MAEYIKREEVIEITAETGALETQARVIDLPSIDIVHCKDCKYTHRLPEALTCRRLTQWFQVKDDDYCSYGERKE